MLQTPNNTLFFVHMNRFRWNQGTILRVGSFLAKYISKGTKATEIPQQSAHPLEANKARLWKTVTWAFTSVKVIDGGREPKKRQLQKYKVTTPCIATLTPGPRTHNAQATRGHGTLHYFRWPNRIDIRDRTSSTNRPKK